MPEEIRALVEDQDPSDYILTGKSCWVTVENVSVWIRKTDEGVLVEMYPHLGEMMPPIMSSYVSYDEAETEELE